MTDPTPDTGGVRERDSEGVRSRALGPEARGSGPGRSSKTVVCDGSRQSELVAADVEDK
jgi:hypothetical protein